MAWAWRVVMAVVAALAPGYVHPDEHFQSPEVAAGDVFGFSGLHRAWEFQAGQGGHPYAPARSAASHFASSGLPFVGLRVLVGPRPPAWALLVAPRLWMALLWALTVPPAASRLVARLGGARDVADRVAFLLATSWTALLHARPLSNGLEAVAVAALISLALRAEPGGARRVPGPAAMLAFGAVAAVAAFVRFTAIFYAAPLAGLVLYGTWQRRAEAGARGALRALHVVALTTVAPAAAGFAAASLACMALDSAYFGTPFPTVAPWNALQYNARPENLVDHGIHPRATHVLFNSAVLLGPLGVLAVCAAAKVLLRRLDGTQKKGRYVPTAQPPEPAVRSRQRRGDSVAGASAASMAVTGCVLLPLAALSTAPHQEPRFLLPMVMPVVVLLSVHADALWADASGAERTLCRLLRSRALWLAFNAGCAVFWGGMHQAGVVRALLHVEAHELAAAPATSLLFYRTYMPPRFLLALPGEQEAVSVTDLAGAGGAPLSVEVLRREAAVAPGTQVLVAAPSSVPRSRLPCELREVARFWPHFSGEDPPASLGDLALVLYRLHGACA